MNYFRRTTQVILLLFVGSICCGSNSIWAQDEVRTWTDSTGERTVRASFVEADQASVKLKKENGAAISVPFTKLSRNDLEYLVDNELIVFDLTQLDRPDPEPMETERHDEIPIVVGKYFDARRKSTELFAGIPFVQDGGMDVVFPVVGRRLIRKEDFRLGLGRSIDQANNGIEWSACQLPFEERCNLLVRSSSLEADQLPVADDFFGMQEGDEVRIHMVTCRRGAKPRVDVDSYYVPVQSVAKMNGKAVGFNVNLDFPNINSFAVATNERSEILGIAFLPAITKSSELHKEYRERDISDYPVVVYPFRSFYDPQSPCILRTRGYWRTDDEGNVEVINYLSTNREIQEGGVVRSRQLQLYPDVFQRQPLDISIDEVVGIELVGEDDDLKEYATELPGAFHYVCRFPLNELGKIHVLKWDAELSGEFNGEERSIDFSCQIQLWNSVQPSCLRGIAVELLENLDESFRRDFPLTSNLTRYSRVEHSAKQPKVRSRDLGDLIAGDPDGKIDHFIDLNDNPGFHPMGSWAFSEDELVAYACVAGGVVRIDLRVGRETHYCEIPNLVRERFCALTSEGLVVNYRGGLLLLDPDTLELKKSIPGIACVSLGGAPTSQFVVVLEFGLGFRGIRNTQYLTVVDTETGRPVHRLKPIFPSRKTEPYFHENNRIHDMKMTRDGQYLFVRWKNYLARIRVEGSELIFEERSRGLWRADTSKQIWVSGDGKFISPGLGNTTFDLFTTDDLSQYVDGEQFQKHPVVKYDSRKKRFKPRFYEYGLKEPIGQRDIYYLHLSQRIIARGRRRSDSHRGIKIQSIDP